MNDSNVPQSQVSSSQLPKARPIDDEEIKVEQDLKVNQQDKNDPELNAKKEVEETLREKE